MSSSAASCFIRTYLYLHKWMLLSTSSFASIADLFKWTNCGLGMLGIIGESMNLL
jgi:hypothetical protein